ncbi:ribosome small subunit-dependent GTPase A [Chloroflexota bacterium]
MKLRDLGLNEWFIQKLSESGKTDYRVARITSVNRGSYLVRNENSEVLAELAGDFIYSAESKIHYPVVGDWVFVQYHNNDTFAIIHDLLPRKTMLRRKASGKNIDYEMIASNVDVAFIVQSCDFNFNLRRLERYLVMINEGRIEPVVLLSKSDLVSQDELDGKVSQVRDIGVKCDIITYSVKNSSGLCQIQQMLQLGVGKTTLVNHLIGRDAFEVNLVREKDGKGRHTTSRRQLVVLDKGAMLIDTPGMRELGNIGVDSGIKESFSDIDKLSMSCRFGDCTHTHEVGCSVLRAVQNGNLNEIHYEDYLRLKKESQHYQMSYLEKRRKDKKFGQFIKSAMKQNKKK